MNDPQLQQSNQSQYSHLTGQWTFAYTYTASGLHLYELQSRWGATVDVLSDPQFQWTPPSGLSQAQYTLSAHLINVQWPAIGPFVVQNFIDADWQATGAGGQTSVVAGAQLALRNFQNISIGGQVQVNLFPSTGGLAGSVDVQPFFSAALSF